MSYTLITCLVLSLLSIILTTVTAIFSFLAYSKVVGMEKSTHQIQWMPVDSPDNSGDNEKSEEDIEKYEKELYNQFGKMYPDIEQEQV